MMPYFRFEDSCNFDTEYSGRMKMAASETKLMIACMKSISFWSKHLPATNGFQIFSTGEHWKIPTNSRIVKMRILLQISI